MGGKTGISWTDATWNPVRGCSRVSEGCRNCYAERVAARFSGPGQPYEGLAKRSLRTAGANDPDAEIRSVSRWTGEVRLIPEHLADPLRWKRPRRIFVNSMSDLFHEKLSNEEIAAAFGVMAAAPQHTFQVLTKRAKRMRAWFAWAGSLTLDDLRILAQKALPRERKADAVRRGTCWPLPNVWNGVSVENQEAADERIPVLLETPAALRFLSCEPLLGEVDLDKPRCDASGDGGVHCGPDEWGLAGDEATPWCSKHEQERSYGHWLHADGGIDWVIAGCESGPGARPCDVAWLRSLRDQCAAAGVPYFLKQVSEQIGSCTLVGHRVPLDDAYVGYSPRLGSLIPTIAVGSGSKRKAGGVIELPYLDGEQHAEFPLDTSRPTPA